MRHHCNFAIWSIYWLLISIWSSTAIVKCPCLNCLCLSSLHIVHDHMSNVLEWKFLGSLFFSLIWGYSCRLWWQYQNFILFLNLRLIVGKISDDLTILKENLRFFSQIIVTLSNQKASSLGGAHKWLLREAINSFTWCETHWSVNVNDDLMSWACIALQTLKANICFKVHNSSWVNWSL